MRLPNHPSRRLMYKVHDIRNDEKKTTREKLGRVNFRET